MSKKENQYSKLSIISELISSDYKSFQDLLINICNKSTQFSESKFGYIHIFNENNIEDKIHQIWSDNTRVKFGLENNADYSYSNLEIWERVIDKKAPEYSNSQNLICLSKDPNNINIKLENHLCLPIIKADKIYGVLGLAGKNDGYSNEDILDMDIYLTCSLSKLSHFESLQNLEKTTHELKLSNDALQDFAYAASHDLQEPARIITSYMELLQKKSQGILDEKLSGYVSKSIESSKRVTRLIKGMLEFSRVNTRGNEFEAINYVDCLKQAIKLSKTIISESNTEITINVSDIEIIGDKEQLTTMFSNLISNSIKFSRENISPKIDVEFSINGDVVICKFKDNGIGIPKDSFDKIFKIYQKLNREKEGDGLGLSICDRIVKRHKGKIEVNSDEHSFTEFIISI